MPSKVDQHGKLNSPSDHRTKGVHSKGSILREQQTKPATYEQHGNELEASWTRCNQKYQQGESKT